MKNLFALLFLFSITANSQSENNFIKWDKDLASVKEITESQKKQWYFLDIETDSIPGTSLNRLYSELIGNKKGKEVIVAVLDTKMDITHEALKNNIWININEITNNGIDDDANGYIDDVNGWNFLGNTSKQDLHYQSTEVVRIIRKFEPKFTGKEKKDISLIDKEDYLLYKKSIKNLEKKNLQYNDYIAEDKIFFKRYKQAKDTVSLILNSKDFNRREVDSLSLLNDILKKTLNPLQVAFKYNMTEESFNDDQISYKAQLDYVLNINYNERIIQGDDPSNIMDKYYGNNIVDGTVPFAHSTPVAGAIVYQNSDTLQNKTTSRVIKLMPIVMVASGDEHDKDVAIAIRYAVDNDAQIINMSFGKYFSMHSKWVRDAMLYAQSKNVLIVAGSGNKNLDIDKIEFFPSDYYNDTEVLNNFIKVGASTYKTDKRLKASFSNYGKENTDIFAPGTDIYTTLDQNKYGFERGTSFSAPIVSRISALLFSYYPTLTTAQVKKIIMDSGVEYIIPVSVPTEENPDQMISFNELSKSGKIVNAYNAFIMAEQMVEKE